MDPLRQRWIFPGSAAQPHRSDTGREPAVPQRDLASISLVGDPAVPASAVGTGEISSVRLNAGYPVETPTDIRMELSQEFLAMSANKTAPPALTGMARVADAIPPSIQLLFRFLSAQLAAVGCADLLSTAGDRAVPPILTQPGLPSAVQGVPESGTVWHNPGLPSPTTHDPVGQLVLRANADDLRAFFPAQNLQPPLNDSLRLPAVALQAARDQAAGHTSATAQSSGFQGLAVRGVEQGRGHSQAGTLSEVQAGAARAPSRGGGGGGSSGAGGAGEGGDSPPRTVFSRETLQPLFVLPHAEAAARLKMSTRSLTSLCKKLGIRKWPYKPRQPD